MLAAASPAATPRPARRSSERLLFDRRYGWIVDGWNDPSSDALAGGRGMFCIFPIAKAVFGIASQPINAVTSSMVRSLENRKTSSVVRTLEKRTPVSCQSVSAIPSNWSQELKHSAMRVDLKLLIHQTDCSVDWTQTMLPYRPISDSVS